MRLKRDKFRKNLKKKGFRKDTTVNKADHHIYFHFFYEGKETISYTYFSHGSKEKDISENIQKSMIKQLQLNSIKEVRDLCNCDIDEKKYIAILKKKKII